jgi:hypothetical protein
MTSGRSTDSLRHHFEVEREIARRLMAADREGRREIYRTMYDELFERVPDHPRLTRRSDPARTEAANREKMAWLAPFLRDGMVVGEFAPGDCMFARSLAPRVERIIGIDISDQRGPVDFPDNFELMVYDGYELPLSDDLLDLMFSDQLLEHLHPEDTKHHLELVRSKLRPGGCYLIRTPHALTGPHDISKHFSEYPEGFHLKEWTYTELIRLLKQVGFRRVRTYISIRSRARRLPKLYFNAVEFLLKPLPRGLQRSLGHVLLKQVLLTATK